MFNETDDYLSAEIKAIMYYHYVANILELKLEYTNGNNLWHHITLVMYEYSHANATYVASNDLGPISNEYTRALGLYVPQSLKRTLHRLRHSDLFGFDATAYNHSSDKQQRCS